MNLNKLAVKAKNDERSLTLLLKKTKGLRGKWAKRFPEESKRVFDVEGELVTLTWDLVRRYDPDRLVSFMTFLISSFYKFVAREYGKYSRKYSKLKMIHLSQIIDGEEMELDVPYNGDYDILYYDIMSSLQKTLRGAEKAVLSRTITGRAVSGLWQKYGRKRITMARKNVFVLTRAMLYMDGDPVTLFSKSVRLRGMCDTLYRDMKRFNDQGS